MPASMFDLPGRLALEVGLVPGLRVPRAEQTEKLVIPFNILSGALQFSGAKGSGKRSGDHFQTVHFVIPFMFALDAIAWRPEPKQGSL
jgi:hypothetical protein